MEAGFVAGDLVSEIVSGRGSSGGSSAYPNETPVAADKGPPVQLKKALLVMRKRKSGYGSTGHLASF